MKLSVNAMCVTPFGENGDVDDRAFAELVDRIASHGLGLFVGGSSPGQGYTLTPSESTRLLDTAAEAAAGRVRVMASGFEPRTAQQLIDFAHVVRTSRAHGVQVYSLDIGHGGRPGPSEIQQYFSSILSSIRMPAVISTHENMGYLIPLDVLQALVDEHECVVGLNINTKNIKYLRGAIDVASKCSRNVEVHVGSAESSLAALALGANGFLSAEANLAPEICASVIDAWETGDIARLSEAYRRMTSLTPIMEYGTATRGVKAAMQMLGLSGFHLRPPLLPLKAEELSAIANCLSSAGLITPPSSTS